LYFLKVPIRAVFANFAEGLKTRFSFRTDSILCAGLAVERDDETGEVGARVDMGTS
jgi:hypothetical protein